MDIVKFIDEIIWYSILEQPLTIIVYEASLAFSNKIDNEFKSKLEEDNNAIATKTQLYSSFHNVTCFKYEAVFLK